MKKVILVVFLFILSSLTACTSKIDTSIKPGNEGFVLGDGDIGVLLAHGLSSSPHEVKELSEYLAAKNITVYSIRLAGHGTSIEDLATKKWEDWYFDYKNVYLSLKSMKKKVFVGGMSLGGVLALKLAEDENTDGIFALSPALILDDKRSNYAWVFKYFSKYSLRTIPKDLILYNYDKFSIASVAELVELSSIVIKDLSLIDEPILIMQYRNDTRVNPESSQLVNDKVSSDKKELVLLNGTGHVFLLDDGKEGYFEQIYQFIKANT